MHAVTTASPTCSSASVIELKKLDCPANRARNAELITTSARASTDFSSRISVSECRENVCSAARKLAA